MENLYVESANLASEPAQLFVLPCFCLWRPRPRCSTSRLLRLEQANELSTYENFQKLDTISTSVLALTSVIGVGAALVYYFKDWIKPVYLVLLMAVYLFVLELFISKIWKVIK